jgi:hypothetical protein
MKRTAHGLERSQRARGDELAVHSVAVRLR